MNPSFMALKMFLMTFTTFIQGREYFVLLFPSSFETACRDPNLFKDDQRSCANYNKHTEQEIKDLKLTI